MRVTKMRLGYRIMCNDSEFEALRLMLDLGRDAALADHSSLSNSAKSAIRRDPFTTGGGPLLVTEDRRVGGG